MNKDLNVPIDKPIREEIEELQEEIQEENKEFLDAVKSKEYLIFYNAIKRALRDIIIKVEIVNIEKISVQGETKPEAKESSAVENKSKTKEEDYILKNTKVKFETDKAYLLQNENDLVAWIPKSCMKSINSDNNIAIVHGWWKEKVQFNEEEPFNT